MSALALLTLIAPGLVIVACLISLACLFYLYREAQRLEHELNLADAHVAILLARLEALEAEDPYPPEDLNYLPEDALPF